MNSSLAADFYPAGAFNDFEPGTVGNLIKFPSWHQEVTPVSPRAQSKGPAIRVVTDDDSEWIQTVVSKVTELLSLEQGWDSYGALPLDLDLVANALGLLSVLPGRYQTPVIFPTSKGGVQLEWQGAKGELEVTIEAEAISYLFESSNVANPTKEGLGSYDEIVPEIKFLTEQLD